LTWTLWDDESRTPDPILDPLGVRQFMLSEPNGEGEQHAASDDGVELPAGVAEEPAFGQRTLVRDVIARVAVSDREGPLEIEFDPYYTMDDAEGRASWEASDENGTHLLQIPVGAGAITALTDDYFLTTLQIAALDHAELVYRLARQGGRSGAVWIVTDEDWPRPWTLLVSHAWMALISLGVLVAAWIWSSSRRFGPLRADDPLERRRLMEHIEASGRFHWRHGGAAALLEAERSALLERVRVRHPGWLELQPRELHGRLAHLSGIPRERIDQALAFRRDSQPERFARNVATLEKIRRSL
jgi:hypothetical protein